jgi:hypothetical protein
MRFEQESLRKRKNDIDTSLEKLIKNHVFQPRETVKRHFRFSHRITFSVLLPKMENVICGSKKAKDALTRNFSKNRGV